MTTKNDIQERHQEAKTLPWGAYGPAAVFANADRGRLLDELDALTAQLTSVQATNETLARELVKRDSEPKLLALGEALKNIRARFAEEEPAAVVGRDLSGDEDTVLTPVHGGHVFAGTWEQFQERRDASCAACGQQVRGEGSRVIGPGRLPCPGWASKGAGDALRRVVRAVTRDRDGGEKPNGPHELAVERFADAFNRLLDQVDAGKPRDELSAGAQTAARGFLLLLNTKADECRALEHALAANDPHKALRSFMAALPSTDAARERGPVEDAFARLDAAIDKHGGTVAIAAAAEELADVIRARLREVATFALAWRDTVREHVGMFGTARGPRADDVTITDAGIIGRGMVDPYGVLAQDLMHAHLNPPEGRTIEERIARETAPHPPTIPAPPPLDEGLVQEVASAAAEHRDDVVLQALHVAGGAVAIGLRSVDPSEARAIADYHEGLAELDERLEEPQ